MGGRWGHGVHAGGGGLWAGGWVRAQGERGCGELSRRASPCGRPGGGAAGGGQSRPGIYYIQGSRHVVGRFRGLQTTNK